ncbi:MAG: Dabb family protein [Planctomycetia bacterium]|nr:Dabb family protein [Planctomycetia bacterium]
MQRGLQRPPRPTPRHNAGDITQAGCREHLTGHPGTRAFAVGTCADYDRQVNDRDYDVTLVIVFDSRASHDAYQTAERHNRFIAEHADSWAKVRIFDADLATLET